MKSQDGFITIDFLFAFVLVMVFSAILFALTMTLTVAEVTQYITFAAARNYSASHLSAVDQQNQAQQKFTQLVSNPAFASFYSNGWFQIDSQPMIGHLSLQIPQYQQPDPTNPDTFWGVGVNFTAKILDFQVPFYGSTAPDSDGSGSGFKTFIASYLSREPSIDECYNFNVLRWTNIRQLPVSGASPYSTNTTLGSYYVVTDNGC